MYLASELSHVPIQLRFQIRTYIYFAIHPVKHILNSSLQGNENRSLAF